MEVRVGGGVLRLMKGDITTQDVGAVVNAANPSLMGGGGVDGAIHRRGGPEILKECKWIRRDQYPKGLPTGEAVITTGGRLKAKHVIHTVGPVWRGGGRGEAQLLSKAYESCLRLAVKKSIKTIAFPSISTGAYAYPLREAAEIALKTVKKFIESENNLDEVRFILYNDEAYKAYVDEMESIIK